MKTENNILVAFILNLAFSLFEFFGGIFTGSVAIISDAIHDVGDAASIGLSFVFEKKRKKQPDATHTYGYARYSVIGSVITTLILLVGSVFVIYNAIERIINPVAINYDGMLVFAIVGVLVNFFAAFFTRHGDSLNQKAVNLHMLEDVLGWVVVLVGAIVMRFTDFAIIDPVMSIGVALFIFISAIRGLKEGVDLFLEKAPEDVSSKEIKEHILKIEGISDVHHIHVWSMDGSHNYATMHIVTNEDGEKIKHAVREELTHCGIGHATLELEKVGEECGELECRVEFDEHETHHHHHHHHH